MVAQPAANNNNNNNNDNNEGNEDDPPQERNLMDHAMQILMWMFVFQFISSAIGHFLGTDDPQQALEQPATVEESTGIPMEQNRFAATTNAALNLTNTNSNTPRGATSNSIPADKYHALLWPMGTTMDLTVYFTESPTHAYNQPPKPKQVLGKWTEEDLHLQMDPAKNVRKTNVTLTLTEKVWNNATQIYAHVYLRRKKGVESAAGQGGRGKKQQQHEEEMNVLYKSVNFTQFKLRRKPREDRHLLSASTKNNKPNTTTTDQPKDNTILGQAAQNINQDVILLYLKPSLTLQLVADVPPYFQAGTIPPPMQKWMDFYNISTDLEDHGQEPEKQKKKKPSWDYYPVLFPSEFWLRSDSLLVVNGTLKEVMVECSVENIRMWKWQLMAQMEETWKTQDALSASASSSSDSTGSDSDLMRTILMDTNPWLLGITALVSVLHTVFDFLAFKNDITFFKGKTNMEGLSLRSMLVNAFFQVVIFLYLADNETSFMVLASNGVGLLIEFWKITKAMKFSLVRPDTTGNGEEVNEGDGGVKKRWWNGYGRIRVEEAETYAKSKTKEYDEIATSHLLYVTMPLVGGYGIYSLVHQKHKGWYSWVLNTLVGFIYMFGFVMMTPQLFINYKLQSVAHMNWRTMSYKCMNTFVDDLFAFVIKMPIMHRLACLRDDLIFFVFLYQRYKYRTDFTRVNEYGQCSVPVEEGTDGKSKGIESDGKKNDGDKHSKDNGASEQAEASSATSNLRQRRRGARDKKSKENDD